MFSWWGETENVIDMSSDFFAFQFFQIQLNYSLFGTDCYYWSPLSGTQKNVNLSFNVHDAQHYVFSDQQSQMLRVQSDLSEAPGHGSTLLVHLGAPHHLLPSLKQHQGGELFGQRRRRHLVPTGQSYIHETFLVNPL